MFYLNRLLLTTPDNIPDGYGGGLDCSKGEDWLILFMILAFVFVIIGLFVWLGKKADASEETSSLSPQESAPQSTQTETPKDTLDDSKFEIPKSSSKQTEEKKEPSCFIPFLKFIVISVLVVVVLFNIAQRCSADNDASPGLTERIATINDVSISTSYSFPISVSITVVAKEDIDDLVLKIEYMDSSRNVLRTEHEHFGDMEEGESRSRNISITSFSWSDLSKLNSCRVTIQDGTVSLFS